VYAAQFAPEHEGPHKINVNLFGKPGLPEPLAFSVCPAVDADDCELVGVPQHATKGVPFKFSIVSHDKKGTKLPHSPHYHISIKQNKKKLNHTDTKNANGSLDVEVTPQGDSFITIKVKTNDHVKDSPAVVRMELKTDPSKCDIACTAVLITKLHIHAIDAYGKQNSNPNDKVEATIIRKDNKEVCPPTITNNNDGTFYVQFLSEAGEHDVDVKINGKPARDCPFVYTVPSYKTKFSIKDIFSKLF